MLTLSGDLNPAERLLSSTAGLKQSSQRFSEFDEQVGLLGECAGQNLSIDLQQNTEAVK